MEAPPSPHTNSNPSNLTVLLISPQKGMDNPCIPAKLKGQLKTDFLPPVEATPFCNE